MKELIACPWCGKIPILTKGIKGLWLKGYESKAIEQWNEPLLINNKTNK